MRKVHWAAVGLLATGVVVSTFFLRADDSKPVERDREGDFSPVEPTTKPTEDEPESVHDPFDGSPDDGLPTPASTPKSGNPFRLPSYQLPPTRKPDVTTASKPGVNKPGGYKPAGTTRFNPLR
jgi:hypothetical protein